jgi:hypothetical protein
MNLPTDDVAKDGDVTRGEGKAGMVGSIMTNLKVL